MKAIAIVLGLAMAMAMAAGASRAADLPDLDGQFCQDFVAEMHWRLHNAPGTGKTLATMAANCPEQFETGYKGAAKKLAARDDVNSDMMNYCTVFAHYRGQGYQSLVQCLSREIAVQYERTLLFGEYAAGGWANGPHCLEVPAREADRCRLDELRARDSLLSHGIAAAEPSAIETCVRGDRDDSYVELDECLGDHRRN